MRVNWLIIRHSLTLIFAFISAIILIGFLSYLAFDTQLHYPSYKKYPIRGIDISHHQGTINWTKVAKAGIKFAYIKASEGERTKDKRFRKNLREARDQGIIIGGYHFFTFRKSGEVQANNFIEAVPLLSQSLPPAVDVETSGNSSHAPDKGWLNRELRICLQRLEKHYGQKPIIYANKNIYGKYLEAEFQNYDIWIRDIFLPPSFFLSHKWTLWQYHDRGRIPGIDGPVDLNLYCGDEDSFDTFTKNTKGR